MIEQRAEWGIGTEEKTWEERDRLKTMVERGPQPLTLNRLGQTAWLSKISSIPSPPTPATALSWAMRKEAGAASILVLESATPSLVTFWK